MGENQSVNGEKSPSAESGQSEKDIQLVAAVNEALLRNGWDYDDRKRVSFMLRNKKLRERTLDECLTAVYKHYGTNLSAFFEDTYREARSRAESRRLGGV